MIERLCVFGALPDFAVADSFYEGVRKNESVVNPLKKMICTAKEYRLHGDVYKSFIAWLLINDENPFSLCCEMSECESGALYSLALKDASLLFNLFNLDYSALSCAELLNDFEFSNSFGTDGTNAIGEQASRLALRLSASANAKQFLNELALFYKHNGVGMFGLNKAFYLDTQNGLKIIPISEFDNCTLDDMWGYEFQKQQLVENTEAFIEKKAANNVLLYGDSGTGKSTSIKAILNKYHSSGLRMIEVYKHQFSFLPELIEQLRKRKYRFVIYMDDLSFEDFEIEYKFLKAVIEGGLEKKPDNVLIYATSNRRHLIRESFSDRDSSDDIHKNDTVQEKLSLADRFGLSIGFGRPMQKEYFEIVKYLAKVGNVDIDEEELISGARQWGLKHGGISGRVARQYINHLKGIKE